MNINSVRTLFALFFLVLIPLSIQGDEAPITVMIPMRDGFELPTDIYSPEGCSEIKPPCVLLRSPAGRKSTVALGFLYLTKHGYAVAIQDTRSFLDKEGKTMPYLSDGWGAVNQDGYDTVEWLARSDFTNGKIGTAGLSAMGITQLMMAPAAPPSLKCQYIGMAASNLYEDALFPGGTFCKNQVEGWLKLFAKDTSVFNKISQNRCNQNFWDQLNATKAAPFVNTPGLHLGGWFDIFSQGTIDAFVSRQQLGREGAKGTQKLIMGPWVHHWPIKVDCGDYKLSQQAMNPPVNIAPEIWFDFHLKGEKNSIEQLPPVTYYVMGPMDDSASSGNRWKEAKSWPVPFKETAFYFTPEKKLSLQPMPVSNNGLASLKVKYDPENPIPTAGGKNLFLKSGPTNQCGIEAREDLVVFTSEPLENELEVTGRVLASLYFESEAPDIDLSVRLSDVYPDGKSVLILDGIANSRTHSQIKGQPSHLLVDLWSTSIVFAKGHRIRVAIGGSNYPRFEKNAHPANTSIYLSEPYNSKIILPVIPNP